MRSDAHKSTSGVDFRGQTGGAQHPACEIDTRGRFVTRVLLVEDDVSLGRTLAERLQRESLTVEWAQTIADARSKLAGYRDSPSST